MALVISEAEVEVTVDGTKVPGKVADDIEKSGSSPMNKAGLGLAGKMFAGFLAFQGTQLVGDWLGGSISKASDLNESLNKSRVIFGEHAAAIEDFGKSAAKNLGLSNAAAVKAASGFGDMFTQIGFTTDAAASMSQQVVIAAADLGSFSNLETADVTERISAAFRGEYDSLQQVIPNINAARVESEAMAATGKTTAESLTAQEKATAVLAIITKDGSKAMGDFSKTSDDYANSSKIAQAQLEDLQAEVGEQLLPIMTDFMNLLNDEVVPALSDTAGWIEENKDWLGPLATTLGVATAAVWAFNIALNANPIILVISGIVALIAGIVWLTQNWDTAMNSIGEATNWVWLNVIQPVANAIIDAWTTLYYTWIEPIITAWNQLMAWLGESFNWLWLTIIQPVLNGIGAAFNWIYGSIISPVVNFIVTGLNFWGSIMNWLWLNAISPALNGIGSAFNWVWGSVISPVVNAITGAINGMQGTFGGIAAFMGNAFRNAMNAIKGPVNGIIGLINQAIGGINGLKVTIPDWVPGVGGQSWGVSLPKIPMLARGAASAPDTFIAGEAGPELIVGAGGARVYPNNETRRMMDKANGPTEVNANITVKSENPELAGRQLARALTERLGI